MSRPIPCIAVELPSPPSKNKVTRDLSKIPPKTDHKIIEGFQGYPFYMLLLSRFTEDEKFLAYFTSENWGLLDNLSGEDCLFFLPYPKNISPKKLDYTKKNLSAEEYQELIKNSTDPNWSVNYAKILGIKSKEFPCLFIATNLEDEKGIVVNIPKWGDSDLNKFFDYIFDEMSDLNNLSHDNRLKKINHKISNYKKKYFITTRLVKLKKSVEVELDFYSFIPVVKFKLK